MKTTHILSAVVFSAVISVSSFVSAGTLENLERERALTINTMLDPEVAIKDRQAKMAGAKVRLIDLERMVLRDKKLTGRNTPAVRQAFENYDLTFLVHGATEKNISIMDAWLNQLGMTTQSVLSATLRRR
jgi:hypothetical protein